MPKGQIVAYPNPKTPPTSVVITTPAFLGVEGSREFDLTHLNYDSHRSYSFLKTLVENGIVSSILPVRSKDGFAGVEIADVLNLGKRITKKVKIVNETGQSAVVPIKRSPDVPAKVYATWNATNPAQEVVAGYNMKISRKVSTNRSAGAGGVSPAPAAEVVPVASRSAQKMTVNYSPVDKSILGPIGNVFNFIGRVGAARIESTAEIEFSDGFSGYQATRETTLLDGFWRHQKGNKAQIRVENHNATGKANLPTSTKTTNIEKDITVEFILGGITVQENDDMQIFKGFNMTLLNSFGSNVPMCGISMIIPQNEYKPWLGTFMDAYTNKMKASSSIFKGYRVFLTIETDEWEIIPYAFNYEREATNKFVCSAQLHCFVIRQTLDMFANSRITEVRPVHEAGKSNSLNPASAISQTGSSNTYRLAAGTAFGGPAGLVAAGSAGTAARFAQRVAGAFGLNLTSPTTAVRQAARYGSNRNSKYTTFGSYYKNLLETSGNIFDFGSFKPQAFDKKGFVRGLRDIALDGLTNGVYSYGKQLVSSFKSLFR